MKLSSVAVGFGVLLALGAMGGKAENAKKPEIGYGHCATFSPLKKAPTLDGKIEPGEWDGAVRTVNFLATQVPQHQMMDPRLGTTYCGFTEDRLYIAVVSELPPRPARGPYSYGTKRDADAIFDPNAVEIWLDPNRDRRDSGEGDQSFYQLFVTTLGTTADLRVTPGKAPDSGWDPDVQTAQGIDTTNKIWTTEISIPFKDLGWTGPVIGRSIGVLISRNYKSPWCQVTWFPHKIVFVSWQFYPRLYLTQDEPAVAIESLGDKLFKAQPDFRIKIRNPGPARKAQVNLHITSTDMPDIKDQKELDLPADGASDYTFAVPPERLHVSADHKMMIHIGSADQAKTWFDYSASWSANPLTAIGWTWERRSIARKWDIRMEANPADSLSFSVYPYYNQINLNVDAGAMVVDPEEADKDKVSDSALVTITNAAGKELAKTELKWDRSKGQRGAGHSFKFKDIPESEYTITAVFNKQPGQPISKKFSRTKFEFEHNTRGLTDKIYPPFEPVTVDKSTVKVVGREYGAGDLGLWKSVKSVGEELLAGPIVLKATGAREQGSGATNLSEQVEEQILIGKGRFTSVKPTAAVYEGIAQHPAVTVKSRCTTEIDGCTKVELTLLPPGGGGWFSKKPEPRTLDALVLDIPLKDELMPLWHVSTTQLRVNPVGATPSGTGVVWNSAKFPDGNWFGNFKCYLWLGGAERGLAWFADNDRGWTLKYDQGGKNFAPCQEIIRKDGVLTLRINLVQKPVKITEPRTIVFGLMASPGKPMPKDWRRVLPWWADLGPGYEKLPTAKFNMFTGIGMEEIFCSAYPINRDYSLFDAIRRIKGTPGGDMVRAKGTDAFLKDWLKRNGLDKPKLDEGQQRARSRAPGELAMGGIGGTYNAQYWDEYHGDSWRYPERQVFAGEWNVNNMAQSRRDFRCYHAEETVKRGFGLYFDNAFPHACYDTTTSDAYVIPGLGTQPSANLWAQRDYHRRIWNIIQESGGKAGGSRPISMIHMTNTGILPYLTWNDMNIDLEWFYGPEPQQSKYAHQLLLAESAGRQFGCYPFVLATVQDCKSPAEERIAKRSKFGAMAVHEIKIDGQGSGLQMSMWRILFDFGYGKPECTVFNYWDKTYPAACDNPEVKSLLLANGKELLLVVCSWVKDPVTAQFTFNTKTLGVTPSAVEDTEKDAISSKLPATYDAASSRLTLGLEGYGVRIMKLK